MLLLSAKLPCLAGMLGMLTVMVLLLVAWVREGAETFTLRQGWMG